MRSKTRWIGASSLCSLALLATTGCVGRGHVSDVCRIERPSLDVLAEQMDEACRALTQAERAEVGCSVPESEPLLRATHDWLWRVDRDLGGALFGDPD